LSFLVPVLTDQTGNRGLKVLRATLVLKARSVKTVSVEKME
jgi:hypothetical protein